VGGIGGLEVKVPSFSNQLQELWVSFALNDTFGFYSTPIIYIKNI
jgi:hypothetical protein